MFLGRVVSSMGNTLRVFVGMKCSHTGHSLPHRLTEWIGCHGNHESYLLYLAKDLSGYCDLQP